MAAKDDKKGKGDKAIEEGRRNFLKGTATAGAGLAATAVSGVASADESDCQPENPYGARPGGGISLPEEAIRPTGGGAAR